MSQTVLQYSAHCCVLDLSWNRVLFAWDWDKTVKNVLDSEMRPSKRGLDSGLKCGLIGAIMRTTQHLTVAGSTMTRELVCRCCDVTSVADISGKYQTSHQQPAATGPREPGPTWSNQSSHPNPIWNRPTGGNVSRTNIDDFSIYIKHTQHGVRLGVFWHPADGVSWVFCCKQILLTYLIF